MSKVFAITGPQEPAQVQLQALDRAIEWIRRNTRTQRWLAGVRKVSTSTPYEVPSGPGLATIGCARTYNPHVQAVCDRVICLTEVDSVDMMAAYASLDVYHPVPRALTGSMSALHARNLLIIRGTEQTPPAEQVIAFPSNKRGGGGTGQGFASPMAPRRPAGS